MQELGSQPLPVSSTEELDTGLPRPRSGTWGSKSDPKQSKDKDKHKNKDKSKHESKSKHEKDKTEPKQKDKKKDKHGSRSGSASRSSSAERRKSGEDIQSPKKPGMLEAFRSRSSSDASKKKGSAIMATMKSAMVVSAIVDTVTPCKINVALFVPTAHGAHTRQTEGTSRWFGSPGNGRHAYEVLPHCNSSLHQS